MEPFFLFAQFEFTHGVGPGPGRYLVAPDRDRDDPGASLARGEPHRTLGTTLGTGQADVLVVAVHGANRAPFRLRRKARPADPAAGVEEVPVLLAAYVEASTPIGQADAARRRLDEIAGDEALQQRWIDEGLDVLNRAIRAYRAGAGDPYLLEVARRDARVVRIGYATTTQVADGRWTEALEIPPPPGGRQRRARVLAPAEAVADAMTGRLPVLECEDLLLRVHLDLDHRRWRAAALQLAAAAALLATELPGDDRAELAEAGAALARVACERPLDDAEIEEVEALLHRARRVVEHRRATLVRG